MIGYIEGKIIIKKDKFIIVQAGGVGYEVFLSQKSLFSLPPLGEQIKLYCYHNVTETASDLYGFFTQEDMDFFEVLMDIRGVGPKAALQISAAGPLDKIKDQILAQDENVFAGIPGIGAKKAMTIILELTGKIKMVGQKKASGDPAEDTLVQLGFTKQQARDALSRVSTEGKTPEERIQLALKYLGK
jgi:Holliday junction DNA helicase RuvA